MAETLNVPVQSRGTPFVGTIAVPPGLRRISVVTHTETFPVGVTLDVLVESSFDGGASWRHAASTSGARPNGQEQHVSISVSLGTPYPTHLRVTVTPQGGSVTYGATIEVA